MNLRKRGSRQLKTVSFIDFRDYIEKKNPTVIIYDDENNSNYIKGVKRRYYDMSEPLKMCLSFSEILIYFNPNIVYLRSNSGTMTFCNVQKVRLNLDNCALGDIITLYCGTNGNITAYTLIIR